LSAADSAHQHAHDDEATAALTQRVNALVTALERRGVTSEVELASTLDRFLAAAGPANGARLVARAWLDPAFCSLLLEDANRAIEQMGLDLTHWAPVRMRAVANTANLRNVIVCTLCSCYPIALLGPSPNWYKSEAYRSRVVREPRAVLQEFGCPVAPQVEVRVWDSTAELRYFVVPERPSGTEMFDERQLAACVSRDALIGVADAIVPTDLQHVNE
jgi:nitrile hydratase